MRHLLSALLASGQASFPIKIIEPIPGQER